MISDEVESVTCLMLCDADYTSLVYRQSFLDWVTAIIVHNGGTATLLFISNRWLNLHLIWLYCHA